MRHWKILTKIQRQLALQIASRYALLSIIIYIFYTHSFLLQKLVIQNGIWSLEKWKGKNTWDIISKTNDSSIWRRAILYGRLLSYLFTVLSCQYCPFATFSCWMDDRYEISERIDRSKIEIVVYWKPTATNLSNTILVKVIFGLSRRLPLFFMKGIIYYKYVHKIVSTSWCITLYQCHFIEISLM